MSLRNQIGGVLAPESLPREKNTLLETLAGPGDDVRHMMSGRCAIMLCIEDWKRHDARRVAYLPAYTCETVSGCFYKQGYRVYYYDVDRNMNPLYDESLLGEISLFLAVGYYGFTTFENAFLRRCRERGIGVIVDATHSVFSRGGAPEGAHYIAASLRKWLPVPCGGIAIKRGGAFQARPAELHRAHMALREEYFRKSRAAREADSPEEAALAEKAFWDAELLLREVYGVQESDGPSREIVERYPVDRLRQVRRQNFNSLAKRLPPLEYIRPVFSALEGGTVPSHFTVYAADRDRLQALLRRREISSTAYWPVPPFIEIDDWPGARWVYGHVLSLPCDQRYGEAEMARVAEALEACDDLLEKECQKPVLEWFDV